MGLIAYAQLSSRLGGGIVLIIGSILFGDVYKRQTLNQMGSKPNCLMMGYKMGTVIKIIAVSYTHLDVYKRQAKKDQEPFFHECTPSSARGSGP